MFSNKNKKLDDYCILNTFIENVDCSKDFTEYIIRVTCGLLTEDNAVTWTVSRRYNDFYSLESQLHACNYGIILPAKKAIGNMDREFIAERRKQLHQYLDEINCVPFFAISLPLRQFLTDNYYTFNHQEQALQNVSMVFRSEPQWQIVEPCSFIGSRIRKSYFKIKSTDKCLLEKYLLSWIDFGIDFAIDYKEVNISLKSLTSLSHPFISTTQQVTALESGCQVIRKITERGSLRDVLHKLNWKQPFIKKFCQGGARRGFDLPEIKYYGRQILEALKFIHKKGWPYGHLHLGNVLLHPDDNVCQVAELESSVLGLSSIQRVKAVSHRKINTLEQLDIFSFGLCLYEMTFGQPLSAATWNGGGEVASLELRDLMVKLLSSESLKVGLPTLADLQAHAFFSSVALPAPKSTEKNSWNLGARAREILSQCRTAIEQRLKVEQRQLHNIRRRSQAQALSEQERRQRASQKASLTKRKSLIPTSVTDVAKDSTTEDDSQSHHLPLPDSSTKAIPVAPPLPTTPSAPPPPPLPPSSSTASLETNTGYAAAPRSQLLSSIQGFAKGHLKSVTTKDSSAPRV